MALPIQTIGTHGISHTMSLHKCMVQMYGTNVWYKCMVQMNIYITSFMGCIGLPRTMEYIIV